MTERATIKMHTTYDHTPKQTQSPQTNHMGNKTIHTSANYVFLALQKNTLLAQTNGELTLR